ncbi:hypothetical protein GCM10027062_40780 [Nocardioides hungaricus]
MKVSILSAVFNEEQHLQEMIDSVRNQDHQDWEVLFVSDGSTDATYSILQRAAIADDRIKVVGPNLKRGKVGAFNEAFRAASGEVIILLAGDDTLPRDSLRARVRAMRDVDASSQAVVSFFKLRTMSTEASRDGLILPRKKGVSNRSGGTTALTRHLAERVFPINPTLISEDLWLGRAAEALASEVRLSDAVVLNYRIHSGNSNPRSRPFQEMSDAIAARHRAWEALLSEPRFDLDEQTTADLRMRVRLEELRRRGQVARLLSCRDAPVADRLAFASMASPRLFWLRNRLFRVFSGRSSR